MKLAGAALGLALAVSACGGHQPAGGRVALIAVNAPFSRQSALGEQIARGVSLAAAQINAAGGIRLAGGTYRLRVKRYDNGLSAGTAVANVRHAIADGAVAIVDEGTGAEASWREANAAGVPICIVHQGAANLVDPRTRPNVFRIVPTDHGIALRFAEYLARIHVKPAILYDDSAYGLGGRDALDDAFSYSSKAIAAKIAVSADASDLSAPVLRARRANPTALLVWGGPATIAAAVRAARVTGWAVPIYAPPDAADPVVREELSEHPDWVDGLTFADGRLTAEVGPGPFETYLAMYDTAFGADRIGVKNAAGQPVSALPEYAMYASDFVNLLASAIRQAGGTDGRKLIAALNQVSVRGANGDERGFNENYHEGVVNDDVYFAAFHDMTFRAVKDDPLSSTLPVLTQVAPR
ncbi:ABC transporter substrate-binding protein [Candidatus Solirubrobacter pratensis]|uniref:ABC transporter substrate-binding protein n=1 Tax=Candidatus Solirubrobacter pratensis TaxID=1298857 RepID=UPI00041178D5|nr:ABC transporter substrate-binding protein [Candidatus Solirubrobacter pratensis]